MGKTPRFSAGFGTWLNPGGVVTLPNLRGGAPILLLVQKASGHGGGTTITTQIEQTAEVRAFLMAQLGMSVPK